MARRGPAGLPRLGRPGPKGVGSLGAPANAPDRRLGDGLGGLRERWRNGCRHCRPCLLRRHAPPRYNGRLHQRPALPDGRLQHAFLSRALPPCPRLSGRAWRFFLVGTRNESWDRGRCHAKPRRREAGCQRRNVAGMILHAVGPQARLDRREGEAYGTSACAYYIKTQHIGVCPAGLSGVNRPSVVAPWRGDESAAAIGNPMGVSCRIGILSPDSTAPAIPMRRDRRAPDWTDFHALQVLRRGMRNCPENSVPIRGSGLTAKRERWHHRRSCSRCRSCS